MPVYADPVGGARVGASELETWTTDLVGRLGAPPDVASDVATVLVASDRRGIASHGTARLPRYVTQIECGTMDPAARPEQIRSRPAMAFFDAHNGWGHHAGRIAVDTAIAGARLAGSFTAVVRSSNHYGIAGWYALRIADAGLIGFSFTNSSPLVAPTRALEPMLGSNPIAVAAPAGQYDHFYLDMATSTIPRGRIEVAARRGEVLQPSWAIDREGQPAFTPEEAFAGALLPLGGCEETGGYKGYGLTLLVDILTGVLSGSTPGPLIAPLLSPEHGSSDLGHTFVAIDPEVIDEPGAFEKRMEHEIELLVGARTAPNAPGRVLIPGEPEAAAERRSSERGISLDQQHLESLQVLADRYEVPLPETRPL